jgi:hypothetical protein
MLSSSGPAPARRDAAARRLMESPTALPLVRPAPAGEKASAGASLGRPTGIALVIAGGD